ncbi:MAG: alpha/beta hydrolase [Candidatus Comchoanobacterales bacterium]
MKPQASTFKTPDYLLDLLHYPADGEDVVLICHPDPRQQGTMMNKVVVSVAKAYQELGVNAVTFNFRAVKDAGHQNINDDIADTQALLSWIMKSFKGAVDLVGFSFGSWVVNQCQNASIRRCLLIAPPIEKYAYQAPKVSTYMIQGTLDDVVSPEATVQYAQSYHIPLTLLSGCGHFFHQRLLDVKKWVVAING